MIIMRKRRKIAAIPDIFYEAVSQPVSSKETNLKMVSGSTYYPKDNEKRPRGDDAYFICAEQQTFGLADGVGGWARKGIDPGEYARELMTNASISVLNEVEISGEVNPLTVLTEAYSNTKALGSSTACIITLKNNYLYAANVGDSGFFVFRKGELVYESPVQQRRFNCPFQLGNSAKSDRPSSAEEIKVKVEDGDIVIAGTDGLLDNMFASEIKELVALELKNGVTPWRLAHALASNALHNSFGCVETPFSKNAKRARLEYEGGKIDDITVIVSHIITV